MPQEIYSKGETFNGKLWAVHASMEEAKQAINKINNAALEHHSTKGYAKREFPVEMRVVRSVLFEAKTALMRAEWDQHSLWVDTGSAQLYWGEDIVLTVAVQDAELKVDFEDGWIQYFDSGAWVEDLANLKKKLQKKSPAKEGIGKGKHKGSGKGGGRKGSFYGQHPASTEFHPSSSVMTVYSKNACISNEIRIANVLLELSYSQWDVVWFCETRAASADLILVEGHRLICYRGESYGGVAVLLHASLADKGRSKREFGEGVLAMQLQDDSRKLTIISAYMPHAGYKESVLEAAYDDLSHAVRWARSFCGVVLIGGDFNTTVAGGLRSAKLLDFAAGHGLTITNEQEDAPINEKYTFESSLGRWRQLDYILAGPGPRVVQASAVDELCLGSGHRAVKAVFGTTTGEIRGGQRNTCRPHKRWEPTSEYQSHLAAALQCQEPQSLQQFEEILATTASGDPCGSLSLQGRTISLDDSPHLRANLHAENTACITFSTNIPRNEEAPPFPSLFCCARKTQRIRRTFRTTCSAPAASQAACLQRITSREHGEVHGGHFS